MSKTGFGGTEMKRNSCSDQERTQIKDRLAQTNKQLHEQDHLLQEIRETRRQLAVESMLLLRRLQELEE